MGNILSLYGHLLFRHHGLNQSVGFRHVLFNINT
jgi:hypothetical protein